ncbi:MAG TPA: transcriptional regulator CynR [Luteibacter sp.]|jgi:LysR family cyn operon transcriptional activator|nr:transcriptional regulator CynR [Luteibacter sp.]
MLLRHIRYFLAVMEHRNFTRAAEALHVSQPTLSQQIRQLEDALGAQLLDRSGRTIRLTDAGKAYAQYARRALQDLDAGKRAIHDARELTRGDLRLAMTPTFTAYLIGPLVARFNATYPGINLSVMEVNQDHIEALLAEDDLDIGIGFMEARSVEIESRAWFVETLAVVVGKMHPYATRRRPLPIGEFEKASLVLLSDDFATRGHIDRYCQEQGVKPHIAIEANSVSGIIEIVQHSDRLATVLPGAVAHRHEGLCPVRLREAMPQRTVALLQRKAAYRTAACQAFLDMASEWS